MIVVDFETHGIEGTVPPKPVGVAIQIEGRKANYLAWAHPTNNNTTIDKVRSILREVWRSGPLLFHNAKFDLRVAQEHFGLRIPPWNMIHDTLFLAFLMDPHKVSGLKETAERVLAWKPGERDAVGDWLVEHKIIPAKYSKENLGRNIWRAPGDVVGRYAIGDVERTLALFKHFMPRLSELGMGAAYDRERQLLPILIENERTGMRLDVPRLERDLPTFEAALKTCDAWVRKRLKAKTLNVDSAVELAAALKKEGVVTEFVKTPKGNKDSISKKNLTLDMYRDPYVAQVIGYRGKLETLLANSMRPWLAQARTNRGFIATEWNQVRSLTNGTRSGRLSCSRFQNIAKEVDPKLTPVELGVPPLPLVRRYILPDRGHTFVHRDYNQQEFRILAHFEDGLLLEAYQENPHLDYHVKMQELIKEVSNMDVERKPCKILNFGINYGMGIAKLTEALGLHIKYRCRKKCDHSTCKAGTEARRLRSAQRKAVPGIGELNEDLRDRASKNEPIITWGGRRYFCEDSKTGADGETRTFEYKLLNYLIQGSAADCTKEALVRYHAHPKKNARFLVTVHDEINVSAPAKLAQQQTEVLREVMESIEFDVPMLSDGKMGPNWGEIK